MVHRDEVGTLHKGTLLCQFLRGTGYSPRALHSQIGGRQFQPDSLFFETIIAQLSAVSND